MPLNIIGTGFGRTGTESMRMALNMLGFGPTHHMHEVIASERQKQMWRAVAKGAAPDWEQLFHGYSACLDWPSVFYWPELIEAYPQTKVLMTWRSPESWWASFEKTILQAWKNSEDPDSLIRTLIAEQHFGGKPDDRDHAIRVYEQNIETVQRRVSPDRLLIHRLGDGWEPLCDFLGCEVPGEPYPRSNSTAEFNADGKGT